MINILEQPMGLKYKILLDKCSNYCTQYLLVVRDWKDLNQNGIKIIKDLNKFLLSEEKRSDWPGTKLIGSAATVYRYILNVESLNIIKNEVNGLYEWICPNAPEDLCLLNDRNEGFLVSISHEEDSFIQTNEEVEKSLRLFLSEIQIAFDS